MKKACEALQEKRLISDLSGHDPLDEECTEVFLLERL